MVRHTILFTESNEAWLRKQVDSNEYASKSEVVNDLVGKARENEYILNKLIRSEKSGFSNLANDEILVKARATLEPDGKP